MHLRPIVHVALCGGALAGAACTPKVTGVLVVDVVDLARAPVADAVVGASCGQVSAAGTSDAQGRATLRTFHREPSACVVMVAAPYDGTTEANVVMCSREDACVAHVVTLATETP